MPTCANNAMKQGATLVFSTGPTIPTLRINGIVFDWVAERPAPNALIEAITPDSIVYLAQADSLRQLRRRAAGRRARISCAA